MKGIAYVHLKLLRQGLASIQLWHATSVGAEKIRDLVGVEESESSFGSFKDDLSFFEHAVLLKRGMASKHLV